MEKLYRAKRHLRRKANLDKKQRFLWGVVCILLAAVLLGMWIQAQALRHENGVLLHQLSSVDEPDTTCRAIGTWNAGATTTESVTTNGTTRNFYLRIPANFEDGKYYPLLVFYVGRGAVPNGDGTSYGLDKLPVIVAYPIPTMGAQNMTAWEGAPYSSGADDIAYTTDIINKIESKLCVDRTRIYAAGFSNGGGFAALLSCKIPERFAAYAIIAGAMYPPERDCAPDRATPLVSVHGDSDTTVPYNGSAARNLPAIESWVTFRAGADKCGQPVTSSSDSSIIRTTWENCRGGSKVENVRVVGGAHGWGQIPNETIWQFLAQFTL